MADIFVSHLEWSGSQQGPTRDPATFSRNLDVTLGGLNLPMSSAPGYRGDPQRFNPEQLFVAALSACQALTYLYLAARSGIAVVNYTDQAEGRLSLVDGRMRMGAVTLRPRIVLERDHDREQALALVDQAHQGCFIGNSVSTPVRIEPQVICLAAQD
jgi:organic hydroperoxide reductase OsmC/OhrA